MLKPLLAGAENPSAVDDIEFLSTKPVLKTGKITHASP